MEIDRQKIKDQMDLEEQVFKYKKISKKAIDSDSEGQPLQKENKPFLQTFTANNNTKQKNTNRKSTKKINSPKLEQKQTTPKQEFTDRTPDWALPPLIRDKNKNKPGDINYNPSTLFIPPSDYKVLTNTMKQFWDIKSQNMDKIILFKLGKFYQLFYQDAAISHQICQLNWMGTKMHTGFPQKNLQKYCKIFVQNGYKVIVVEQMQTVSEMQKRYKSDRKSGKFIKRQITQVLTQGTFNTVDGDDFMPKYLLCIRVNNDRGGITIIDTLSNRVIHGYIGCMGKYTLLKTLLCQIRPKEILYDPDNIPEEMGRILRSCFLNAQMSPYKDRNAFWHYSKAANKLDQLQKSQTLQIYQEQDKYLVLQSISGCFNYLQKLLLHQNLNKSTTFMKYLPNQSHLYLPSATITHLNLLQSPYLQKTETGTILNFLDFTGSKMGKRKLHDWICAPLANQRMIEQRLDAIQDLQNIYVQREEFRKELKKTRDTERILVRIYQYSVKSAANQAIYFSDVSSSKLKQLKQCLNNITLLHNLIQTNFFSNINKFKSLRLKRLITKNNHIKLNQHVIYMEDDQQDIQGLLPNVEEIAQKVRNLLNWDTQPPSPPEGKCQQFQQVIRLQKKTTTKINEILTSYKKQLKDPGLSFSHAKQRYQIEISTKKNNPKSLPQQFQFSSSRQGYQRYVTSQIRTLVSQLQHLQQRQKKVRNAYVKEVILYFANSKKQIDNFIDIIAQLDVLASLSYASNLYQMTRPLFVNQPSLYILEGKHPSLLSFGKQCVPNTIKLDKKVHSILLTGPNMGGKSTFLRMSCCLIILAQIGCYVPAKAYECSIFDKIFTRLGASDSLIDGKSTFMVQMEEARQMIQLATQRSICILDELGRGTSTFDGVSIAASVLKQLISKKSFTLFATHYHLLLDYFYQSPQIKYYHMAFKLQKGHVRFLYRLAEGRCLSSMGMNVCRMAGVSEQIIKLAQQKAQQFDQKLGIVRKSRVQKTYQQFLQKLQKFK